MILLNTLTDSASALSVLKTVASAVAPVTMIGLILAAAYVIKDPRNIDFGPLERVILIVICMSTYVSMASLIQSAVDSITNAVRADRNISTRLSELAQIVSADSEWSIFPSLRVYLANALAESLASTIVNIIKHFQQIVLLFLYLTGPISIVLSTIPMFNSLFAHWFRNFLGVQCWGLTFAILDNILWVVTQTKISDMQNSGAPGMLYISVDSAMIDMWVIVLSYLFVSTLTMYYIGRNEGGNITRQITQTVAQLTMAVKTFGASAAARGAMAQAKSMQSFASSAAGSTAKPAPQGGVGGNYTNTPSGAGFQFGGEKPNNSAAQSVFNGPKKKETTT